MKLLRLLRIRFALALIRNILLKIRLGKAIEMNIFKTYFAPSANISISGKGKIIIANRGKRIYISDGCDILASDGTLQIEEGVFFNRNCTVVAHQNIFIGAHTMFGPGVCVFDSDHTFGRTDTPFSEQGYTRAPVQIGSNVWIGANAVVVRGTNISENVVVGANSVARGQLLSNSVYAGNPLRRIREIATSDGSA